MLVPQLLGIAALIAVYIVGELLALYLKLPIPGSVIGLVFCAGLMLAVPFIRTHIRPGALVLLALVPLFLVPVLVRMAVALDFTAASTWLSIAVLCVASVIGVVLAGLAAKICLLKD